ncbi:MAG: BrnT family toxin [Acidaminococcaceae bacterium]|nr:BrnT family toxin [Acidaminococcaceae bacterium]
MRAKHTINKAKHKVSFEEAQTVFYDADAIVIDDLDRSETEERFIILGFSAKANLLIVFHCCRESDRVIRIIFARKVTTKKSRQYAEFN